MAMLAEPRQRKRYNLVPKGKALFEDGDRFGTKMLEKMGWSKGKGLGAREDGQQEFVRVRYKNDANGLGFEDRDDQWTEHEKHFNGLLENLNSGNSNTNSASDEGDVAPTVGLGFVPKSATKEKLKDKFSGQSLEEKSKNSKARVHYKKFTRGKDMSQYSEKDLANIFGKKATPDDENIYSQFQAFGVISGDSTAEKKEESPKKPVEIGTHIINTGVSVSDYFKQKMAALKGRQSEPVAAGEKENNSNDEVPIKKKKSKKRSAEIEAEDGVPASEETDELPGKKKKQKKQAKSNEELPTEGTVHLGNETTEAELNESNIQADVPPKKKKKSKKSSPTAMENDNEEDPEHNPSKKIKLSPEAAVEEQVEIQPLADEVPSKKKANKKTATEAKEEDLPPAPTIPIKKKKSKKQSPDDESSSATQDSKSQDEGTPSDSTSAVTSTSEDKPKKKKKKNKSKPSPTEPTPAHEVSSHHEFNHLKDNCLLESYTISTFCAEKFRNIEFYRFNASNVSHITGYGLSEDLQLKIKSIKGDQERIMKLWSSTLDKYQFATPKHKIYNSYVLKVKQARKSKSRVPKIKVKCLKRRHVFQGL